jgi:6-phosphofructokinase 1
MSLAVDVSMRVAVLTSGGDAPGMNAAIRAVVRSTLEQGWQPLGVSNGYEGLLSHDFRPLSARDVGGVMQRGGTFLGSARCPEMKTDEGLRRATDGLKAHAIDALVVVGGNGSQAGAHALSERGVRVVGVASTIDNDLIGCDVTIGATTALDVALEAIDRLKVTASSHHRAFLVEVMGRNCGYLALMAGLAGGAEAVAIPEVACSPSMVIDAVSEAYRLGKAHALIVVAEGVPGGVSALERELERQQDEVGFDVRVTRIGHVQRGGAPGAFDRILASRTGAGAVEALAAGRRGVVVGMESGQLKETPLEATLGRVKPVDPSLFELARVLAR